MEEPSIAWSQRALVMNELHLKIIQTGHILSENVHYRGLVKGIVHLQLLVPNDFYNMKKKNTMQVSGDQLVVHFPFKVMYYLDVQLKQPVTVLP